MKVTQKLVNKDVHCVLGSTVLVVCSIFFIILCRRIFNVSLSVSTSVCNACAIIDPHAAARPQRQSTFHPAQVDLCDAKTDQTGQRRKVNGRFDWYVLVSHDSVEVCWRVGSVRNERTRQ